MDEEQLNEDIARLMDVAEDVDERLTEQRERTNRIENELAASIAASRSADAAILAEFGRLNAAVSAIVGISKREAKVSETDDKVGEEDENKPDKKSVEKPPVTPSEPAPPKRRHRFL